MSKSTPPSPSVEALAAQASRVAAEDARLRAALAAEGDARSELLRQVLAAVAPALPALSGRILLSSVVRVGTDRSESDEQRVYYSESGAPIRGVHVAGDATPRKDLPSSDAGTLRGRGIWLLEDGRFLELSFDGRWSKKDSPASTWIAQPREVALGEIARDSLTDVLARLASALEKQTPEARAVAAEARTARLRAVLTLLGDLR